MALVEYRHGALAVVQNAYDKGWIDRLLKQLDPALFLEQQLTVDDELVWCVVEDVGLEHPPVTVYEFRDGRGRPIPYPTEQIVEEMRRRQKLGVNNAAEAAELAHEKNVALRKRRRAETRDTYEGIAADFKRIVERGGGSNGSIPRSPGLAATRRRMRRKGIIR